MKNNSYKDFIRQENELTKLKIQAEFGINLDNNGDLNPAVENIWLNQILELERSMADSKKITVAEYLENPVCKPVEQLNDEEVAAELQKLMELMHEKKLVIDSVCGVEDREMYRFITKELFAVETDSSLPKNMIVCYIYEEFHPNDEYDLKRYAEDFIQGLKNKEQDLSYGFGPCEGEVEKIKQEQLLRRLGLFRDAFHTIEVEKFEIVSVQIGEEEAEVKIKFKLGVYTSPGSKKHMIEDNGKIIFLHTLGYWYIKDVDMKGVC